MKYAHISGGNFGDDINSWIWEKLRPGNWENSTEHILLGIGSPLGPKLDDGKTWYVLGAGAGYKKPHDLSTLPNWKIFAVRGPLSAIALGLAEDKAVTDGAILLGSIPEFKRLPSEERSGIIFIPHHRAASSGDWESICAEAGLGYVDPRWDSVRVIEAIRSSSLVISGAMHAAIIADTMRVRWVPVTTSSMVNQFKWLDWTLSMGVPYNPIDVGPSSISEKIEDLQFRLSMGPGMSDQSTETALRYLRRKNKGQLANLRYYACWRLGNSTRWILRRRILKPLNSRLDDKHSRRAILRLIEASENEGFLSSENMFNEKLSSMTERLDALVSHD